MMTSHCEVFGGLNIGRLLSKPPICQNKFPTKISSHTVFYNIYVYYCYSSCMCANVKCCVWLYLVKQYLFLFCPVGTERRPSPLGSAAAANFPHSMTTQTRYERHSCPGWWPVLSTDWGGSVLLPQGPKEAEGGHSHPLGPDWSGVLGRGQ